MLSFRQPSEACARAPHPITPFSRERYRENCIDEDGHQFCVIVWEANPLTHATAYTLLDGSPVRYVSNCEFEIVASGKLISRCE